MIGTAAYAWLFCRNPGAAGGVTEFGAARKTGRSNRHIWRRNRPYRSLVAAEFRAGRRFWACLGPLGKAVNPKMWPGKATFVA